MNQLPLTSKFICENKEFITLQEAALSIKNLTFNPNSEYELEKNIKNVKNNSKLYKNNKFSRSTIFKEIKRIPIHNNLINLYHKGKGKKKINEDKLSSIIIETLYEYLKYNWNNKEKIMFHSAGYDSRILSGLICNLRKEIDIGKITFVCWQPELNNFKEIMKYQEWDNIILCNEKSKEEDYFKDVLDFNKIGKSISVSSRSWLGPILASHNLKHSNMTGIAALFYDEIIAFNKRKTNWINNIGEFVINYLLDYYSLLNGTNIPFILPFISEDFLKIISEYDFRPFNKDKLKLNILSKIDKNLLKFTNPRSNISKERKRIGYNKYNVLSDHTQHQMSKNFKNSWYCKTFKKEHLLPMPKIIVTYDFKIAEYIKASILEYLIKEGCNIEIT